MLKVTAMLAIVGATASPTGRTLTFEDWAAVHGRGYATAALEERARQNFVRTEERIVQHNGLKLNTWRMGHTQFSDLTDEEFTTRLGGNSMGRVAERPVAGGWGAGSPPKAVDWVSAGKVTPIKNQSHCGACWAMVSTHPTKDPTSEGLKKYGAITPNASAP